MPSQRWLYIFCEIFWGTPYRSGEECMEGQLVPQRWLYLSKNHPIPERNTLNYLYIDSLSICIKIQNEIFSIPFKCAA